jgi:hypothetical protein
MHILYFDQIILQIQVQYIIKSDQVCEEVKQNEQNTLETTGNKVLDSTLKWPYLTTVENSMEVLQKN